LTNKLSENEILLQRRKQRLGPNVSTFYDEPIHLVKGEGTWVWDKDGRKYLDCYNNVAHVGHCHPKVVDAIYKQASTLNTHTRYLHENILDYADSLTSTFSDPLSSVIMTCSGSEANDIALRMAQAMTGKTGIIATDHTYHGNTESVSRLSRTNPPIGGGADRVKYVPAPDSYRPLNGIAGMPHAEAFAHKVEEAIVELENSSVGFSGMILCPYFANEGFPSLPPGWLDPTIAVIKKAGGLIIADEVQPGFGRIGSHMWAHQYMRFIPDIVTLGKPMGNGHPVSGLVTSPEILSTFRHSFRYFNTFGGNPVSCAAAMATLQVLEEESLMENANTVGEYARKGLEGLAQKYECIGDVRGSGLFFGAEMVLDKNDKTPATAFTQKVVNGMRENGILINKLGIHYNVLKVRPPMVFGKPEADLYLQTLDHVLSNTPLEA